MNKLGVHALVWEAGWSHGECARAIAKTAEVGYDFIEAPALDPGSIDVDFSAGGYLIAIRNVRRTELPLQGSMIAAAPTEALARHRIAVTEEGAADRLLRDIESL